MFFKEKIKELRQKRYMKKYGRRDFFTWIHRYFRLHTELLEDSVYQRIYDYVRNTLIAYSKREMKLKTVPDEEYGELIDTLADIYNRGSNETVNKYKRAVELLYKFETENYPLKKDVRI